MENQAFRSGSAVGVQFHPEVNDRIITEWAKSIPIAMRTDLDSPVMLETNRTRCCALINAFLRGWAGE